MYEIVLI